MRFLDLFAGIGGFSLGLERAGMTCVGQVEIDPFCNKVLEKHWPNVKRMKDIHDVTGTEFGTVELICGGFPCQPFSTAGKRRGAKDDRYLWPEMFNVIQAIRPRWVFGENVAGIVKMELDKVLSDLESEGYVCQSLNIPACSIGAEHNRGRIWIIANTDKDELCGFKFSKDKENSPRLFEERIEAGSMGLNELGSIFAMPRSDTYARNRREFYGIPSGMDRLGAIGNAVVPQIVTIVGMTIMETERIFKDKEAVKTQ